MAGKATDKAPGTKTRTKKPAAAATQKEGASAPSSAGAVETSTQAATASTAPAAAASPDGAPAPAAGVVTAASPADVVAPTGEQLIEEGGTQQPMGMGMGRFPEGWAPAAVDPAESAQTLPQEPTSEAAQSDLWGMPDITQFPVTLKLVNNSPARVRVLAAKVWVLPGAEQTVQCMTAEQYRWMQRDLSARARSCRWDSTYGLKVTYEQN